MSTRSRIRRMAIALALVAGTSWTAAPPVMADHSFLVPARENGCGFDLLAEAEHKGEVHFITFTNLASGATYLHRSRYTDVLTLDASGTTYTGTLKGTYWVHFTHKDARPDALVGAPSAEYLFAGTINYTTGKDGFYYTSFSYTGSYEDLCTLLS